MTKPILPQTGGSYTREKDGALKQKAAPAKPAPTDAPATPKGATPKKGD